MKRLVILGAGTAGTMMANHLAHRLDLKQWNITVVDRDNDHIYQPGLLFLPFGQYRPEEIRKPRNILLPKEVDLLLTEVSHVDPTGQKVHLVGGDSLDYDLLIVATGTRILPEETEGLTAEEWQKSIFDFYTLEGASALAGALDSWKGGRMVVNFVDMPIKCPVAPLEFLFLADAFFSDRGIRDDVEIVYATPLDGAFTKPKASAVLGGLLESKNISVEPNFAAEKVDGKSLASYDGRKVDFDLLVTIPLHGGSAIVSKSGLGDEMGFVPTHKHSLVSKAHDNIFVLGDATDLPTSKAGSVAHFQAEVLTENVVRAVQGKSLLDDFDGHANCFIETGHGKAVLIDFNYETEPLPGRFPLPGIGPFTLLEESHTNHWGKLAFKAVYWNMLLRGEPIPLDHRMLMAGKWS